MKIRYLIGFALFFSAASISAQCVTCISTDLCGAGLRAQCYFIENGCFAFGSCIGSAACNVEAKPLSVAAVTITYGDTNANYTVTSAEALDQIAAYALFFPVPTVARIASRVADLERRFAVGAILESEELR